MHASAKKLREEFCDSIDAVLVRREVCSDARDRLGTSRTWGLGTS